MEKTKFTLGKFLFPVFFCNLVYSFERSIVKNELYIILACFIHGLILIIFTSNYDFFFCICIPIFNAIIRVIINFSQKRCSMFKYNTSMKTIYISETKYIQITLRGT
jgi:hypothetical protein